MTEQEIFSRIDHTLLKANSSWDEIQKLCSEAVKYKTASACIPPSYVKSAFNSYGSDLNICTVIGFPLGYSVKEAKLKEAEIALADGANEIDMVINIGDLKNGNHKKVEEEISAMKKIAGSKILKVIVETCYLTTEEKINLCRIVSQTGANYIKTSTGFGTSGAAQEDIILFKEHISPGVKIKASGGIKTRGDLEAFIKLGCSRIGTSSAITALENR